MRTLYNTVIIFAILFTGNIAFSTETPLPNERAEIELLKIIDYMRNGNNADALIIAEELTKKYPNFKLGKIIYADLLSSYLEKSHYLEVFQKTRG